VQLFSINSVQIRSWSYIDEGIYNPDPIQIWNNPSSSRSSPIQRSSLPCRSHVRNAIASRERQVVMRKVKSTIHASQQQTTQLGLSLDVKLKI